MLVTRQRWRLLGHTLRMPSDVPANLAMHAFCTDSVTPKFCDRSKVALPIVLDRDFKKLTLPHELASAADVTRLRELAQDRAVWKALVEATVKAATVPKYSMLIGNLKM
jgi:hypothetical protein